MKKLICILLAVLAALSFAACKGTGDRPSGSTPTPADAMRPGSYTCKMVVTGSGDLIFRDTATLVVNSNKEATAQVICTDRRVSHAAIGESKFMPRGADSGVIGETPSGSSKDYPLFELPAKFDVDIPVTFYYEDNGALQQVDCVLRFLSEGAVYKADSSRR